METLDGMRAEFERRVMAEMDILAAVGLFVHSLEVRRLRHPDGSAKAVLFETKITKDEGRE